MAVCICEYELYFLLLNKLIFESTKLVSSDNVNRFEQFQQQHHYYSADQQTECTSVGDK
jgi:hypothetical protein